MRLYFFLEKETRGIHLIAIGDKTTQPDDNQKAKDYVSKLMKERSQATQD